MFELIRWLPALLKMKDVSVAYKEETGKDKPAFMTKRFIGSIVVVIATILSISLGVTWDQNIIDNITENIGNLMTSLGYLYGIIMVIKGVFDANKRKTNGNSKPEN